MKHPSPREDRTQNVVLGNALGYVVRLRTTLACLLLALVLLPGAVHAHLMQAQRGTLNLVGDGAFMVLALPASAFATADLNRDGKLSLDEFRDHQSDIHATIQREVSLLDDQGPRPLHILMLSTAPPDETPDQPSAQLIVLGRFALARPDHLRFRIGVFGLTASERSFQITVTRRATAQSQLIVLTAQDPVRAVFPSSWSVFVSYVALGAKHILAGLDHLLFLVTVLSAAWSTRQVLMGLTMFTVGHAITLAISVLGGRTLSPAIVEPTIAATIVAMVAFDSYARHKGRVPSFRLRLALLFACSLVHGLGLSAALMELGLERQNRLLCLFGFNTGIELAQVMVALLVAVIALCVRRALGSAALNTLQRATSYAALVAGAVWFFQRVAAIGSS
jgi:hypothetical protein